jgi:transposase
MVTRLSNHIRGTLKTFGVLPVGVRGMRFDRRIEAQLNDRADLQPIVAPVLAT